MERKKVLQTRATKASNAADNAVTETAAAAAPTASVTSTKLTDISQPSVKTVRAQPIRFSEMDEPASGRGRVIRVALFAAVIVLIGIGAILAIENANKDATNNSNTNNSSTSTVAQVPGYDISRTVLTDDEAGTIPRNGDFSNAQLALGSAANAAETMLIEQVNYDVFSSVTRLTWELSGITSGFPPISVNYDTNANIATVIFTGVDVAVQPMLTTVMPTIGSVDSITASSTADGVQFTLQFNEAVKYAATISSALGEFTLDVKTNAQLNASASSTSASSTATTTSVTSTSVTSSASTSSAVTGQKLDNSFSEDTQTISSGLSNTVLMRNYFFQDFGPHFEFSWTFQGTGAESVPPKVEAKYITDAGKSYIEIKMEGIAEDLFQARSWPTASTGSANLQYANFVRVIFKGWDSGTKVSTYWVEVKGQEPFRLHATGVRNDQQKVTIEIKD